jgi:hypothetical protein
MDYNRPNLGERLAADYVLGLMPPRARQRFERELAASATLSAIVAGWSERFAPLDDTTRDEAPPAHIWRAIDRRIGAGAAPAQRRCSLSVFWRGVVLTAVAACAAVIIYVAPNPAALHRDLRALADRAGISDLVGSAPHAMPDIGLSTMRLGVPERERPRWLRAALLLSSEALPLTTPPATQPY